MIRIGNQTACWAASPREPFDYAVASGFDAFEWFPDKKPNGGWDETDLDKAQRCNFQDIARGRGMRVSVHARWQANPLQPDALALLEKDIQLARDLGAVLLNLHLYHERGLAAYVEAIRPLLRLAAGAGLQLSIENTPHHTPEEFNQLFAQLQNLDAFTDGQVGMCLDLGHANLCAATRNDYLQYVDRLASQVPIIHLHLHENYGDADTHLPLFTGPAGRDDAGIRGLLARLRRRQFAGSIILEQWPQPPWLLKQARDRLIQLWNETNPPPTLPSSPERRLPAGFARGEPNQANAPEIPPPKASGTGVPSADSPGGTPSSSKQVHGPDVKSMVEEPQWQDLSVGSPPSPRPSPPGERETVSASGSEDGAGFVMDRHAGKDGTKDAPLDEFARKLVEGDRRSRSWREKLDFIRELLVTEFNLGAEQLVDLAVYLRFLGTGEITCVEDGRHFRPAHHARIAQQIQARLAMLATPENAFIIRKIHPWLPSTAQEFQRAEPLTRIRDIAHRNDIPAELKHEIKHSLQNKLHRCAGPEDLATATTLLERITAPGTNYAPAFIEQFRIFHEELREFFNARSLAERLQALLPAVQGQNAKLIHQFLKEKEPAAPGSRIGVFRTLTELRRGLLAQAPQLPDSQKPDFLLADIGLEDFAFAWLSGILNDFGDAGGDATWETLLEILQLTLANLELSQVELEECRVVEAEIRAWQPLDPADRDQLLRLKATVLRSRQLAEGYCDRILTWFPPRALALGRALGTPENAVRVFAEAEIRGHLVFQLSKLSSIGLRRIRQSLHQPAWDVVVSGEARGRVTSADRLGGNFAEPVLVLLKRAEGDEEIPTGITGLVLAHELPHLSHLGVRARQAGVVLVTCEETALFEDLKQLEGKTMQLTATTEKVAWHPADIAALPQPPREVQVLQVALQPESLCLPLEQAPANRGGNKADGIRRLAELAQCSGANFKIPPALVLPFGVLVEALRAAPGMETEYRRLVNAVNASAEGLAAARQLARLIQQLQLPETVLTGVAAKFDPQLRLMVRSSANDEDLANLAGAGLYESVANVPPTDVTSAVRQVWASLWSRRAVLSRQQAGISHSLAHMAVLLQQMLIPDYSFILHTVNPLNHRRHEAYAELVVGLGETLASAATRGNPYRLVCDGNSGAVVTLAFANFSDALWPDPAGGVRRQRVDYSHVPLSLDPAARTQLGQRLAGIAQFVESAFHEPQDIEGVVKADDIYLVQSRPQQGLKS